MRSIICFALVIFGLSANVLADTWRLPTVETYCSANKKYCLKVEPKKLESQLAYFSDKVAEKDNAGAVKGIPDNFCKGTFSGKGKRLWNVRLVNEVAPVSALISNNGDYVITFDNWHSRGYGDDAVAIYSGKTGTLIKKLGLADFLTKSDIYNLPASTSSIQWDGDHAIDYQKSELILRVVKPSKDEQFFDVRVRLIDGEVLDEVIDRIPSLQFFLSLKVAEDSEPVSPIKEPQTSCASMDGAVRLTPGELRKRIISGDMPAYPPIARMVRAEGESVFEIVVSAAGEVECVTPISGHPLLRATLVNAVKKWKFQPSDASYSGKIIIEGRSVLMLNGNVIKP